MCVYCDCDRLTNDGAIGERIGGRSYPFFIERYDDNSADFLDGRYWIVQSERHYRKNWSGYLDCEDNLHRQIAINFCPICGRNLHTYD